jgi:hypothetical protein
MPVPSTSERGLVSSTPWCEMVNWHCAACAFGSQVIGSVKVWPESVMRSAATVSCADANVLRGPHSGSSQLHVTTPVAAKGRLSAVAAWVFQ